MKPDERGRVTSLQRRRLELCVAARTMLTHSAELCLIKSFGIASASRKGNPKNTSRIRWLSLLAPIAATRFRHRLSHALTAGVPSQHSQCDMLLPQAGASAHIAGATKSARSEDSKVSARFSYASFCFSSSSSPASSITFIWSPSHIARAAGGASDHFAYP